MFVIVMMTKMVVEIMFIRGISSPQLLLAVFFCPSWTCPCACDLIDLSPLLAKQFEDHYIGPFLPHNDTD